MGVDARWEHCLVVFDAAGNIVEEWTQWDEMFRRPHSVYINPYDAEKHVWVVDDRQHAVYKFTNDGKQLVQTIGTSGRGGRRRDALQPADVPGVAARQHDVRGRRLREHARREVRQGRQVPDWRGAEGNAAERHASGQLQRRARRRRRSRHAPGLRHRSVEPPHPGVRRERQVPRSVRTGSPSTPQVLYMSADKHLWIVDNDTSKIIKYDHGRSLPVLMGQPRRLAGRAVERPRDERRSGGQSVPGRGQQRARAEVQSRVPDADQALMVGKPVRSAW